jgi:hypothetical protein
MNTSPRLPAIGSSFGKSAWRCLADDDERPPPLEVGGAERAPAHRRNVHRFEVRKLGTHNRGMIGLWAGGSSDSAFANLRITPLK